MVNKNFGGGNKIKHKLTMRLVTIVAFISFILVTSQYRNCICKKYYVKTNNIIRVCLKF